MNDSVGQLAILGGTPAFPEKLHVGRPNLGDRELLLHHINGVLDRNWLTNNGVCVQELEARLAKMLGVRHCIMMCNATVALEITIRALGMVGEVIIPSFTFIATAHSLQWQQITPVFCDIDPVTHSIDPERVEELITPRTTGIIGVHLWGAPCATERLEEIARRRNLKLLFDAAHAFACSHRGRMVGSFGDAEVFSFHATKFFNTFEGGAVATNDDELAQRIRLMKNFGFSGYDNVIYIGTNGKMNEISAAMGLASLERLDAFLEVNRRNYHAYLAGLAGVAGIRMYRHEYPNQSNCQYVVVEVAEDAPLSRDQLMTVLHAENILVRRYFYPGCHRMEPYRSYFPHAGLLLPETEALNRRVLVLPTGTGVEIGDVETICRTIRSAMHLAPEIRRAESGNKA